MSTSDESSLGAKLDALLDRRSGDGSDAARTIEAHHGGARVRAEVVDVDRLGVVIERVKVEVKGGALEGQVDRVARDVRPSGQRLRPIEVDTRLGGGVLRTAAEQMSGGRFFQVEIDAEGAELTRHQRGERGRRVQERFTLTREHLGRLVDDLSDALDD